MILRVELEVTKRLKTKAVVSDQDDFLREIAGDIAGSAAISKYKELLIPAWAER